MSMEGESIRPKLDGCFPLRKIDGVASGVDRGDAAAGDLLARGAGGVAVVVDGVRALGA